MMSPHYKPNISRQIFFPRSLCGKCCHRSSGYGRVRVSFKEVDQKIRLHQNLIIETVDAGISMMMTD